MKLQKESLWILLALIVSPFYFVYRETLEVKDGEVRAYKTLWWSRTTEVKSLKPSCVGEVYTKWLHGEPVHRWFRHQSQQLPDSSSARSQPDVSCP